MNFVEDDIVYQRIGANDVVVLGILVAPDEACSLIDRSADDLEFDRHIDIERGYLVVDEDREPIVDALGTYLRDDIAGLGL